MTEIDFTAYKALDIARNGRILTIAINSGAPRNAVNAQLHHELAHVFTQAKADPGSDVVILTGMGQNFCAGGDFDWFQEMIDDQDLWISEVVPAAKMIISTLLDLDKPLICKLNGPAAGLGASIALLSDIVVAADHAKIGDPHVKAGLVAGDGGAIIWPQLVGFARAKEMLMTGRMITAQEAYDMGLINHVVAAGALDAKTDEIARELADGATLAIRYTKTVMNLELQRIHLQVSDAALGYETITNASVDHQEAVNAFKERRAPKFVGK